MYELLTGWRSTYKADRAKETQIIRRYKEKIKKYAREKK